LMVSGRATWYRRAAAGIIVDARDPMRVVYLLTDFPPARVQAIPCG
jgi:hypothetical protein